MAVRAHVFRDGFPYLRKIATAPAIPATTGVTLLVTWGAIRPDEPMIAVVGGALIGISIIIRIRDLRTEDLADVPLSIVIVAVLSPPAHARDYLADLGSAATETRGRERRRHLVNIIATAPQTLATLWSGWLRTSLVRFTITALSRRIARLEHTLTEHPWPRLTLPRLRLFCRLILCATGSWQYGDLAEAARALSRTCRRSAVSSGHALGTSIHRETNELVTTMGAWRPHRV
jgi:hypothetical protein